MRFVGFKGLRYPLTKGVKDTMKTERDRTRSIFPVMSLYYCCQYRNWLKL